MSEPVTPWWLAWILPALAVLGVLWALIRRLFTSAVREEMATMHVENQERFRELESQVADIRSAIARIEGWLKRWGGE